MSIQVIRTNPGALPSSALDRLVPEARAEAPPAAALQAAVAQVEHAVQSANHFFKQISQDLEFSVDAGSGRTVTRLVDKETNTVIRQIPSEEMLEIARALDHFQGLLIRLKA
jgi:flagellar protein FlaG